MKVLILFALLWFSSSWAQNQIDPNRMVNQNLQNLAQKQNADQERIEIESMYHQLKANELHKVDDASTTLGSGVEYSDSQNTAFPNFDAVGYANLGDMSLKDQTHAQVLQDKLDSRERKHLLKSYVKEFVRNAAMAGIIVKVDQDLVIRDYKIDENKINYNYNMRQYITQQLRNMNIPNASR